VETDGQVTLFCLQCGWTRTYRLSLGRVSFPRMIEDDRDHYADNHATKPREGARDAA
jgi:hypothetical protein